MLVLDLRPVVLKPKVLLLAAEVFLRLAPVNPRPLAEMELVVLRLALVDLRPLARVDVARLAVGYLLLFANVELRRRRLVAEILPLTPVERRDFATVDFVPARETRLFVLLARVPRIEALFATGFLEIFLLVDLELRVVDLLPLTIVLPPLRLILHVKYRIYLNFFIFV